MSCKYKDVCPSCSGWCEGPRQDFSKCIPFLITAYENEKEKLTHMTPNEYQKAAMRTCSIISENDPEKLLLNGVMGLGGESGEAIDLMKKHLFQGHELDKEHMAKELGDVAWYLAETATAIGYDLEAILQMNIDKLWARYPGEGFEKEQSIHRKDGDI